jgi:hypothetical protein
MDPAGSDLRAGVCFCEQYEYLPRRGDAGREFTYLVTAPYTAIAALVHDLDNAPGTGDLQDRLTAGFRALVGTGELHADLGIGQASDRVADQFTHAGITITRDESIWINNDD